MAVSQCHYIYKLADVFVPKLSVEDLDYQKNLLVVVGNSKIEVFEQDVS